MVIRRFALGFALSLCVAVASAAYAVADTVRWAFDKFLGLFDAFERPGFLLDHDGQVLAVPGGQALDSALLNDLRHESGVPRRSAARKV